MSQLSLFPDITSPSTFPLIVAPRPCRCGCTTAALGSSRGPHAGELICSDCGTHLMWASHALVAEIRAGFATGLSSFSPGSAP